MSQSPMIAARAPRWAAPLLALIACLLVASTWPVFGHIWDEPEHIAVGLALIDHNEYLYDDQHPPLARLAAAIGPHLAGARAPADAGALRDAALPGGADLRRVAVDVALSRCGRRLADECLPAQHAGHTRT